MVSLAFIYFCFFYNPSCIVLFLPVLFIHIFDFWKRKKTSKECQGKLTPALFRLFKVIWLTIHNILHIQQKQQHGHPFVVFFCQYSLNFKLCFGPPTHEKKSLGVQLSLSAISYWAGSVNSACLSLLSGNGCLYRGSIRANREQPYSVIMDWRTQTISYKLLC